MRKRKNITLSVDRETYRDIRIWCAQRNTTISHVVQSFLEDLPSRADQYDLFSPKPGEDDGEGLLELMARMMGTKENNALIRKSR